MTQPHTTDKETLNLACSEHRDKCGSRCLPTGRVTWRAPFSLGTAHLDVGGQPWVRGWCPAAWVLALEGQLWVKILTVPLSPV